MEFLKFYWANLKLGFNAVFAATVKSSYRQLDPIPLTIYIDTFYSSNVVCCYDNHLCYSWNQLQWISSLVHVNFNVGAMKTFKFSTNILKTSSFNDVSATSTKVTKQNYWDLQILLKIIHIRSSALMLLLLFLLLLLLVAKVQTLRRSSNSDK